MGLTISGDSNAPVQLPPLVVGQRISDGPYTYTVTPSMVADRERINEELMRRWESQRGGPGSNNANYAGDFKEFKVRRRFMRRVFSVVILQQIFTFFIVGIFMIFDEPAAFVKAYPGINYIPMCFAIYSFLAISISDCASRRSPSNILHLFMLTVSLAYLTGVLVVSYPNVIVPIALSGAIIITFFLWATATCSEFDMTKYTGLLSILTCVFFIGMITTIIIMSYTKIPFLQVLFGFLGTLTFSMYLFYDLQTLMGDRSIAMNPNEVVFAASHIYVDFIMIFKLLMGIVWYVKQSL